MTSFTAPSVLPIAENFISVTPNTILKTAIEAMAKAGVSCVLVVNQLPREGENLTGLQGILTEGDLPRLYTQSRTWDSLTLQAVMREPVITIQESELADLSVVLQRFQAHGIRHLPILTADQQIRGVLTKETVVDNLVGQIQRDREQTATGESALWESQRKCTEDALRESEMRFRRMFDSNVVGMFFTDPQGQIMDANDRFLEMIGYSRTELEQGAIPWEEVSPALLSLGEMSQLMEGGKNAPRETEYRRKDGIRIAVLIRAAVLPGSQGQRICVVVDISDRKCVEQENEQLKERLQFVLASSPAVIFTSKTSGDYGIKFISDNVYHLTGYSPLDFISQSSFWVDHLHPEDAADILADLPQLFEKTHHVHEYRFRHREGHYVWIRSGLHLEWNTQGNPLEIVGYLVDISDRREAETKLRQQSDQEHLISTISQHIRSSLNLQEILNTTVQQIHNVLQSDRVLVYQVFQNYTGKVVAESVLPGWPSILNQTLAEEIFPRKNYNHYQKGEVLALTDCAKEEISPCSANFLKAMGVRAKLVIPIIENTTLWGLLIAHQCNAPRHWHTWEIELMEQLAGQLAIAIQQSNLYTQLQDSHLKLAHTNAELIRATRLKDEFLANMSHELRTPLNAILGMSEALQDEIFGILNDRQQNAVSTIERSGQHLLEVINDILEMSKIAAGKITLDRSTVSIHHLCTSSLTFVRQQALKKQIQINTLIPLNLGTIEVDERRIRQVLINLLSNAVKFTPTEGLVTLEVHLEPVEVNLAERIPIRRPPSDQHPLVHLLTTTPSPGESYNLCISVIDTGIGITLEDQAKLFQPFVQIDSGLSRQYEGTGLGLALVKQIVELHGGFVTVRSAAGQGSCFRMCLPYRYSATPETIPVVTETDRESPQLLVTTPLILLAEDNEANISTLSHYLIAQNYRMVFAHNGQEAIDLAHTHHPDLILMDIQMPVMDGLTAIRQIRRNAALNSIPIIALTALAMPSDRQECLAAGANEYIGKPIKLKQLTIVIQNLLAPSP